MRLAGPNGPPSLRALARRAFASLYPPRDDIEAPPPPSNGDDDAGVLLAKSHVKFGNVCARAGQHEKAIRQYELALQANPRSTTAHHNAASILQRLNRFDEAIPHYKAALRLKPSLVEAASNLAVAPPNARRPEDAVGACRHAIALQREVSGTMNLEASHHLNVALRLLGRRAEAVELTWQHIEALAAEAKGGCRAEASAAAVRPAPISFGATHPPPAAATAASGAGAALTVVCVKWGTLYGPEYVNRLSRSCRRLLGGAGVAAFVCFTDDASGLDGDVEARPLPARAPSAPPPQVNDCRLTPDELQRFAFDLCHLFQRATKVVSRPCHLYYAHLAAALGPYYDTAFKARDGEYDLRDVQSTSSGVLPSWKALVIASLALFMLTSHSALSGANIAALASLAACARSASAVAHDALISSISLSKFG